MCFGSANAPQAAILRSDSYARRRWAARIWPIVCALGAHDAQRMPGFMRVGMIAPKMQFFKKFPGKHLHPASAPEILKRKAAGSGRFVAPSDKK
jgi:hypothetical protein